MWPEQSLKLFVISHAGHWLAFLFYYIDHERLTTDDHLHRLPSVVRHPTA